MNINELLKKQGIEDVEAMKRYLSLARGLNDLISKSGNRPPYDANLLDIAGVSETITSLIISNLLNYKKSGDSILCRSFLEKLLVPCGFKMEWFNSPQIDTEQDRIDISIQESRKYAVIIENKLRGALFQRNQIARYIKAMRKNGYTDDQIFVIVLPNQTNSQLFDNGNKSVWRLPKYNQKTTCNCLCDKDSKDDLPESCKGCEKDLKEKFKSRTAIMSLKLTEWLKKDCLPLIPEKETVLRSAVEQFADFLNGIYKNRLNHKLMKEMTDYLREKLLNGIESTSEQWKKLIEAEKETKNLQKGLESLRNTFGEELINEWKAKLDHKWGKWLNKFEPNKYFAIEFQGIMCGCWFEPYGEKPFWGFMCTNLTDEQKNIVQKILAITNETGHDLDHDWYKWDSLVST